MTLPWLPSNALEKKTFAEVRRRTIFECCKWDPQVGDVSVLADAPLVLRRETWSELAALAEALDGETLAAEAELRERPELHGALALPRKLRAVLRAGQHDRAAASCLRVHRYDFHRTTDGWRISEVNSDVPGGFIEASGFTSLMSAACERWQPCGDPAGALVEAIRNANPSDDPVALVHATAYCDDRQVMVYLATRFAEVGLRTKLAAPDHLEWRGSKAWLERQRVASIVRFFPAEWLVNLPRRSHWQRLVCGSHPLLINPASALLTQSKRFPLVWDRLETPLPAWRTLLPETRELTWSDRCRPDSMWVYKPALGRVGDGIGLTGATSDRAWKTIRRGMRWHAPHWIAQRRFEAVPLQMDREAMYPALGVFVIGGRACGIYGRLSPRALIDHRAIDVAVLTERDAPLASAHIGQTDSSKEVAHATT
jgi:glutathionylspermidine synthase